MVQAYCVKCRSKKEMKAGKAYISYQADCSQCFACVEDCPREAISLGWVDEEDLYSTSRHSNFSQ